MMNWRKNGEWGTGKLYSEAASTVFFCGPLPISLMRHIIIKIPINHNDGIPKMEK